MLLYIIAQDIERVKHRISHKNLYFFVNFHQIRCNPFGHVLYFLGQESMAFSSDLFIYSYCFI